MSNSRAEATIDAHYEANYKEKTLIEINRNRLNRKIQNLEAQIKRPLIVLDKLKTLSWSGIPSCKKDRHLYFISPLIQVYHTSAA